MEPEAVVHIKFEWIVRGIDLAVSPETDRDYSAAAKLGLTARGDLVVLDIVRKQVRYPTFRHVLTQVAKDDGLGVEWAIGTGGTQKGLVQDLQDSDDLSMVTIHPIPETKREGSKLIRANRWISRLEMGRMYIVRADWNEAFLAEMDDFTGHNDLHDDQIDAISIAYELMAPVALTMFVDNSEKDDDLKEKKSTDRDNFSLDRDSRSVYRILIDGGRKPKPSGRIGRLARRRGLL